MWGILIRAILAVLRGATTETVPVSRFGRVAFAELINGRRLRTLTQQEIRNAFARIGLREAQNSYFISRLIERGANFGIHTLDDFARALNDGTARVGAQAGTIEIVLPGGRAAVVVNAAGELVTLLPLSRAYGVVGVGAVGAIGLPSSEIVSRQQGGETQSPGGTGGTDGSSQGGIGGLGSSGGSGGSGEGGKRFPPRTGDSNAAAAKVLKALDDAGVGRSKVKVVTVLTHQDGSVSVGFSGKESKVVGATNRVNDQLPDEYKIGDAPVNTAGYRPQRYPGGYMAISDHCAEQRAYNAAKQNPSPVTGQTTVSRAPLNEDGSYAYPADASTGPIAPGSKPMDPCSSCAGNQSIMIGSVEIKPKGGPGGSPGTGGNP